MDTIHALSSGAPPAGVAVIRISGPRALAIAAELIAPQKLPPPRRAMLRSIFAAKTRQHLDSAIVITFPGTSSFTGEESAELHLHGSPAVVSAVQQSLALLGSRPADAGEFTRRAFENGRIDLTQAEALADLIAAETDAQRDQALSNASGKLRDLAEHWRDRIISLMADTEADLDFADEADVSVTPATAGAQMLAAEIESALATATIGERIRDGFTIAVTGPPNAGKSSLINALAKRDVAIVTPHAGTTRDIIEVHLNLGGIPAILLDTAGLRETDDPVEAEGIARARARAASADFVLSLDPHEGNVVSKIDETGQDPGVRGATAYVSAKTGAGLAELLQWLQDWARQQLPLGEPALVTQSRQAHWLSQACFSLMEAASEPDPVLRAESLRAAGHALGRLTGRIDPEAVLGAIFSRFCIGK